MDIFELMDIGENSEIEFKKRKIVFQKTYGKHILQWLTQTEEQLC